MAIRIFRRIYQARKVLLELFVALLFSTFGALTGIRQIFWSEMITFVITTFLLFFAKTNLVSLLFNIRGPSEIGNRLSPGVHPTLHVGMFNNLIN